MTGCVGRRMSTHLKPKLSLKSFLSQKIGRALWLLRFHYLFFLLIRRVIFLLNQVIIAWQAENLLYFPALLLCASVYLWLGALFLLVKVISSIANSFFYCMRYGSTMDLKRFSRSAVDLTAGLIDFAYASVEIAPLPYRIGVTLLLPDTYSKSTAIFNKKDIDRLLKGMLNSSARKILKLTTLFR